MAPWPCETRPHKQFDQHFIAANSVKPSLAAALETLTQMYIRRRCTSDAYYHHNLPVMMTGCVVETSRVILFACLLPT